MIRGIAHLVAYVGLDRRYLTTALLVAGALLVTGCRLTSDVEVTVGADGGGELAVSLAVDAELAAEAAAADADPLATLADAVSDLEGWRVTGPDQRTVTLTTAFDDPAGLRRTTAALADGLAGPELDPLAPMDLVVRSDDIELSGAVDLRVGEVGDQFGLDPAEAAAVLADSAEVLVVARMPGPVIATDGEVGPAADTVEWVVAAGERREFTVRSERPWTFARIVDLLAGPYGVAVAVTVVVVVAWLLLWTRHRRQARSET